MGVCYRLYLWATVTQRWLGMGVGFVVLGHRFFIGSERVGGRFELDVEIRVDDNYMLFLWFL